MKKAQGEKSHELLEDNAFGAPGAWTGDPRWGTGTGERAVVSVFRREDCDNVDGSMDMARVCSQHPTGFSHLVALATPKEQSHVSGRSQLAGDRAGVQT